MMRETAADLATGPASSFSGLRSAIAAVLGHGADLGAVAARYPAEWDILTDQSPGSAAALAEIAISASERRLHRESEQNFRVLQVAAIALCQGSAERPLVLHGVGRSDLATLRGLVRAREYSRATGVGHLVVAPEDAVTVSSPPVPEADYRPERARCLSMMGLDVTADDLVTGPPPEPFEADAADRDRIAAALDYCRTAFYEGNWEGMAIVAGSCLPVAERLSQADVTALAERDDVDRLQAIEVEPALLRHPADVRAYLLKVLGIQATFRLQQDRAIDYFRAMRETPGPLSPEMRAQSHLYAALTLTKRKQRMAEAIGELEAGFDAVAPHPGEADSVRRERGWLHNLRGLVYFRQKEVRTALAQEKAALACLEGLLDPSSIHLRVNLVSNISVLQESAGRLPQALKTWGRFAGTGFEGDGKFVKHHRYRTGGLLLKLGNVAEARAALDESLSHCPPLGDDFHECEIAAELGTLLLDDRPAEAERYFDQAHSAASQLGDPYRIALAATGRSLAAGVVPDPRNAEIAARSITHSRQAAALADDPRGCLPLPRTKLNRPFDLVNPQ